jgi:hypothetical protein
MSFSGPVQNRVLTGALGRNEALRNGLPAVPAISLALLVAGPWLQPGYIFGTDWPGPARFELPVEVSSSAPVQVVLATISWVVGAEATGKLLVFAILAGGALAAYLAVPIAGFVGRAGGATLFIANPFVFGRLHYGQLYLLAGYAVLPWMASRLRTLCAEPRWKNAVLFAASISLVGMFTAHLFLVALVLSGVVFLAHVSFHAHRGAHLKSSAPALALAAGLTFVICSYWLLPMLVGFGSDAAVIAGTGAGLLRAYAAVPDRSLGLIPNLLGLYGFWAEDARRFTSMKAFAPMWPVALVVVIAVSAIGAAVAIRGSQRSVRGWVVGLIVAAAIGLILEMGLSHPLTEGLVQWLDSNVPLYRGMRDAGKWAALLALVYSQLFGLGANEIVRQIRKLDLNAVHREWLGGAAIGLFLAVPLYYGNGLLFGMHGEIKPSKYPAGWYQADRLLARDAHPGWSLFLPWHEYMSYSFIRNQNNVVASPAPTFFSVPILASADPEIQGVAGPNTLDQITVTELVRQGAQGEWAKRLSSLGVKYVLVARETRFPDYAYLDNQPGLSKVADFGSIVVYRNVLAS